MDEEEEAALQCQSELKILIREIRNVKTRVKIETENLKVLKEELRTYMIDSGINKADGVEIRRVISFDVELFRLEQTELFKYYARREQIKSWRNVMTKAMKDKLRKERPEIYKEYITEGTAQVRDL